MDPVTITLLMTMVLPGIIGKCIDVATASSMEGWRGFSVTGNAINQFKSNYLASAPDGKFEEALEKWSISPEFLQNAQSLKERGEAWSITDAIKSFSDSTNITESPDARYSLTDLIAEYLIELSIQLNIVDARCRATEGRREFLELKGLLKSVDASVTDVKAVVHGVQNDVYVLKSQNSELNEKLTQILESVQSLLAGSPTTVSKFSVDQDVAERAPTEDTQHKKIDAAVDHIRREKIELALNLLTGLREELCFQSDTPSNYLLARLAGNMGACYLRLEQIEKAWTEYRTAASLYKSSANFSNVAIALVNLGNLEAAFEYSSKALTFKQTGRSLAVHLQILAKQGRRDAVTSLVATNRQLCDSDADCLLALSQIAYGEKRYSESFEFSEKARALAPYDAQLPILSASALFKTIDPYVEDIMPLDGKLPPGCIQKLEEVQTLTTLALYLTGSDYGLTKNRALELRVAAFFLLGKFAEAEADCLEILKTEKNNSVALLKLAYLAIIIEKKPQKAIDYYEQVATDILKPVAVVVAGAYIDVQNIEKAQEFLDLFEPEATKRRLWAVFASETLRLAELKGTSEASIETLKKTYPDNGDIWYTIAQFYKDHKNITAALEAIAESERTSTGALRNFIPRLKSQIYFDGQLWKQAWQTLEKFAKLDENGQDCSEYIAALANDGLIANAGKAAKAARDRNNGEPIETISEIEAAYYMASANRQEAEDLLDKIIEKFPQSSRARSMKQQAPRSSNILIPGINI